MQNDKLRGVFVEVPPEGELRPPEEVFPAMGDASWLDSVIGCLPKKDANERTYVATRPFPDGRGLFGYLAVSMASGEPYWVRPGGDAGDDSQPSTSTSSHPPENDVPEVAHILQSRAPHEQRDQLIQLFDNLLEELDDAALRPNKEIDDLLDTIQRDVKTELRLSRRGLLNLLRDRLSSRRDRAVRRSRVLDELSASYGDQVDQDDVWFVRPHNIALLEATYPAPLVKRFLDAILRERVSALDKVRARQYYLTQVKGQEDQAISDMEQYLEHLLLWSRMLQEKAPDDVGRSYQESAEKARKEIEGCSQLAQQVVEDIRHVQAAVQEGFDNEHRLRRKEDRLGAELEILKAKEAAQTSQLNQLRNLKK